MNILKTILVSCTLMYSCALLPSAAASQPAAAQVDEFETPDIPLIPEDAARADLIGAKALLQELPSHKHLLATHQAYLLYRKHRAQGENIEQRIQNYRQQEGKAAEVEIMERKSAKIKASRKAESQII